MSASINMSEILITSLLGIMLSCVVFYAVVWQSNDNLREKEYIKKLLIMTLLVQIASPVSYLVDGHLGVMYRIILSICDIIVYASNVVLGLLWMAIITTHLNIKFSKINRIMINTVCIIAIILLVITQFVPIVYYIDENNSYHRGILSPVYIIMEMLFCLNGIYLYIKAKQVGGVLKVFPVWQFAVPIVIGALIQQAFFGITVIIPCVSVSILGLILGLQNERVYSDELTGVYNRFYLDYIKSRIDSQKSGEFTIMMLNLNDFKTINKEYGHAEGDRALISMARILSSAVGTRGSVIRYTGDEFMIILNSARPDDGAYTVLNIRKALMDYNNSDRNHRLDVTIGSCIIDLREYSIDAVINKVDRLLSREKEKYCGQSAM